MSVPGSRQIKENPVFSFRRAGDDVSLFQDNFDFGSTPEARRFASFYELSLNASSDELLLDVYDDRRRAGGEISGEREDPTAVPMVVSDENEQTQDEQEQTRAEQNPSEQEQTYKGAYSETIEMVKSLESHREAKVVHILEVAAGIMNAEDLLKGSEFKYTDLMPEDCLVRTVQGGPARIPPFGIFLKAHFKGSPGERAEEKQTPGAERSALLVRFPYLGYGMASPRSDPTLDETESESWSLLEYEAIPGDLTEYGMSVHQALFVAFNEDLIMTARSKEYDSGGRDIFPHQYRTGAFHLLVQMIADALRSDDRKILEQFESRAMEYDFKILIDGADIPTKSEVSKDTILLKIAKLVIDQQIEILEDLKDMFERAGPDHVTPSIYNSKYNTNIMRIPVLSGGVRRTEEQLHYVVGSLGKIIDERQSISKTFSTILRKMEKTLSTILENTRHGKSTNDLLEEQQRQTQALQLTLLSTLGEQGTLGTGLDEQKGQLQALRDEIAFQGKTVSIFTVLNVIFLPLGFFSQYFQGSDQRDGIISGSLGLFWAVTAPFTVAISAISFLYLFSNYELRQVGRLFQDLFVTRTRRRRHMLLEIPDAYSRRSYLKRLPRYRVKATSTDGRKILYLVQPDTLADPRGDCALTVTSSRSEGDTFCFDEEHGWLFHREVDRYDYTLHAHVKSVFPDNEPSMKVCWRKSRKVLEEAPYHFKGRFHLSKTESTLKLEWQFSGYEKSEMRRWDTAAIKHAEFFSLQNRELWVVNPWSTNNQMMERYSLTMEPVLRGIDD